MHQFLIMSHKRKRKRIKSGGGGGLKRIKTNYVTVFKLADPIIQGMLFIFFVYSLDEDFREVSYRTLLMLIIGIQLLSLVVNLLFNPPELLKKERLVYAGTIIAYLVLSWFITRNFKENYLEIRHGDFPKLPLREVILDTTAIIVSFWYNIICFREIKTMLKNFDEEEN